MKEFIALHNRTVSRDEIQTVIVLAKEQNNTEVIYRLSKILNDHPDSTRFNINIINYPQETTNQVALAGTRHSGDYREALDECGRLKKGWHFVDGKVVKATPKAQSTPKAPKATTISKNTQKNNNANKKYKFIVFIGGFDRIAGIYSYQDIAVNGFYYEKTFDNGIRLYKTIRTFAKSEETKTLIEEQYTEGKDFVYLKFDGKNKEEYYSMLESHSSPSGPSSATSSTPTKNYTAESFAKDLDFNTLKRSYSWISFDPDARAERDIKQWGEIFYSLYNSLSEEAKKQGVLEAYNTAFDNGYTALLKLEREIIATRSKTFSTAITGGAGITEKQVSTNEKRMRQQSEKSELWNQKYDKLHKLLEKIAKNKPADLYEEGDVIKSTDNNAMTKLQQKLKMLQDRKTMLKNGVVAAKEYRKNKDLSVFKKYNIDKETTETIVKHIDNGGSPTEKGMYNWFTMPYLNRDIKEVEKRIAILEKNQSQGEKETLIEGGKIVYNGSFQRLQIIFDGIPSKEVREALKAHAFKWAPTAKAWQRTLTENAKYAVNTLIKNGTLKSRSALAGTQHSGDYREALDDCGRLRKGWHFVDGKVVKTQPKKATKSPTDKSAPSDTESYFLQREEQVKRAELIRKAREQGHTEEEIRQRAKKLGYDNIDLLINLSYLNPKGEISRAYIYYPDNETPTITKMVNWAGEARRKYPFLEDEHEQQFFDLYDQQFYEKRDKKYLFEKIEKLASKYHSFEELMKKHNIKGNVFFFDKLIAAVKVSLRKSNYKEVPNWYIRYSVPIDTDKPLTKENKDFLKKYFVAEVSKVVTPFALKEKYTTWVEFKQKGLELLSKIITPSAKSEKSDSSPKIPALGFLFGKYPEISTDTFKNMKVSELRAFTLSYYLTHLKGKKIAIKNHLKEVIFTTKAGRKIAKGEAMYKEKAAVIEHLEELIKNSTYNNWGSRKTQDNPNILGYLNFKSKLTIDGEKRHVRIAISLTRERKTELKNVEVGKKKSASFRKATVVNPQDGRNETLSTNTTTKTVPNIKESTTPPRKSLANPFCGDSAPTNTPAKTVPNSTLSAPEVFVEHSPDPATQSAPSITPRNNSIANKMATLQNRTFETFIIAEPQMQAFLGDVERKNTGSTAITITGGAGSGKTRFAFQFINALAQNYKVGHASLEEQPDSKLYFDKVQQYLDQTAQANVEAPEIENMQDLQALIERNDVIVIDSFTKIREWDRNFLLDRDLRKKYNGKLFLIIFQQTVAGNMRGGTTSEFDGDIILYTQVFPDYRENYIYPSKNRYNSTPSEQLRYSVYHQQLLPSESTPPDSSPVTSNTYEVIY